MIDKKIHYCWFGGADKPASVLKCINSWKRFFPDYEIIEWNESNFDLDCYPYVKEAYKMRKWAFVTDVARLKIVYENGGIYFDTDVEVIKSYNDITNQSFFLGEEEPGRINTGVGFGAEKQSEIVKVMLDEYKNIHFVNEKGSLTPVVCPVYNTNALIKLGLFFKEGISTFRGGSIYPEEYFSPIGLRDGKLRITDNTHSIHHFANTWMPWWKRLKKKIDRRYGHCLSPLKKIIKKFL